MLLIQERAKGGRGLRASGACHGSSQLAEGGAGGLQGGGNVVFAVGGADEAGLIQRRGHVNAAREQAVEKAVEARGVALHDFAVVLRQAGQQEKAEQATFAVGAKGHALFLRGGLKAIHQRAGAGREGFKKAGFADFAQGGQAAGGGDGVARERAGLIDGAERGELLHDIALAAKGGQGHAAAYDFAHDGDVGREARDGLGVQALHAAQRGAKAGHHFVIDEQRAVLGAQLAAAAHEIKAGAHEVHVARDGFDDEAGQLAPVQGEGFFQLGEVVVFEHQRVLHHFGRHARAGGVAEGGQAGAGLDQQGVGMAVVAAFKFDDLAAARGAARQADGAHARFSARGDEAHHVHAGHEREDFFGQLHFALGGRAKRQAVLRGAAHCFQHGRVAVAEDHGAPGADVVDVALVIGVPQIGALRALDEAWCAANSAEGAHRGIDAPRNDAARALHQGIITIVYRFFHGEFSAGLHHAWQSVCLFVVQVIRRN